MFTNKLKVMHRIVFWIGIVAIPASTSVFGFNARQQYLPSVKEY